MTRSEQTNQSRKKNVRTVQQCIVRFLPVLRKSTPTQMLYMIYASNFISEISKRRWVHIHCLAAFKLYHIWNVWVKFVMRLSLWWGTINGTRTTKKQPTNQQQEMKLFPFCQFQLWAFRRSPKSMLRLFFFFAKRCKTMHLIVETCTMPATHFMQSHSVENAAFGTQCSQ